MVPAPKCPAPNCPPPKQRRRIGGAKTYPTPSPPPSPFLPYMHESQGQLASSCTKNNCKIVIHSTMYEKYLLNKSRTMDALFASIRILFFAKKNVSFISMIQSTLFIYFSFFFARISHKGVTSLSMPLSFKLSMSASMVFNYIVFLLFFIVFFLFNTPRVHRNANCVDFIFFDAFLR